jgi:tetratricopeptide (TPR) repeat protein
VYEIRIFYCVNFPEIIQNLNRPGFLLFIGVLILFANGSFAQSKKQDAYRSYRRKSASDEVTVLIKDASTLKEANPAAALDKVQEALALSVAEGNTNSEAKCYVLLGEINEQIMAWTLAQENYLKAYDLLSTKKAVSDDLLKSVRGLGYSFLQLKLYDKALAYFEEGIRLANGQQKAEMQLAKSEVYYQKGQFVEAQNTLKEIYIDRKRDGFIETLVQNQQAKIDVTLNKSQPGPTIFSNSLERLKSGSNIAPEADYSLQQTKEEMATTYRSRQQYDDEIKLRKSSIEYNQQTDNLSEVTKDKVEIGKTLEAKGETQEAIREMEEAAKLAESINNPKERANALLSLAELYEKNGKNAQALRTYKKYSQSVSESQVQYETQRALRDSIIGKQSNIERLSSDVSLGKQEESLQEATVYRQQLVIFGLLVIIAIIGIAAYFMYRNSLAKQQANQLLALKSLRSQMNPHFIFNALNSVNHFIAQQDERTANKFLSDFSLLMRLVLENSEQDFITLNKEQELLSLYLKLEHYRFRDKFEYEFTVDQAIATEAIELPPMLIQPYIENAIWHGLRYKEGAGHLTVSINKTQNEVEVKIADNGIGRRKSLELKTLNQRKHQSTGLKNINERLKIINQVYRSNYRVIIEDLPEGGGTTVRIYLPLSNSAAA